MALFDIFRRGSTAEAAPRVQRTSSGLAELDKATRANESMSVLNLGPTSPGNISYFTNLGHGIYSEDVLAASKEDGYLVDSDGVKRFDAEKFFKENLVPAGRTFDIALCWDVFDYMEEAALAPLIERVYSLLKPGGYLLAFFHSQSGQQKSPYYRYHITGTGTLDMQLGPPFPQMRTLNNRKVEELLKQFSAVKFLLARDNLREVLARK